MEKLNPEEITENLTLEQLEILSEMANENPVSKEWIECAKKLNDQQKFQIYQKRGELLKKKKQKRLIKNIFYYGNRS